MEMVNKFKYKVRMDSDVALAMDILSKAFHVFYEVATYTAEMLMRACEMACEVIPPLAEFLFECFKISCYRCVVYGQGICDKCVYNVQALDSKA